MAINNNVNIIVSVIDKVKKPLKDISKGFSWLDKSLRRNKESFQKMAWFWGAALTWVWLWIKNLVDQASDLEETTQKFGVVYRDLWDQAEKSAKSIAKWYWLSQRASRQFLADLWDVTSWFWLSQEASLKYAEEVTKMWVDLASFANIAGWSEEAIDRLNKWFLWEHENLKALWIIINDTMLKKQLLADWTSELTWLELEQAKIQARMTIAMSQSKNAAWDFERSKSSLANQTRILQANMEDVTTELWQAFLPIITEITTALVPIIKNIWQWASENRELVKILWIAAIAITWIITVLWTLWLVIPVIMTWITALWTALMFLAANPIWMVITAIAAWIAIWIAIVKNWDTIVEKAKELWNWLVDLYDKYWFLLWPIYLIIEAWKLLYKNFDLIKEKAVLMWESIIWIWNTLKEVTIGVWNEIKDTTTQKIQSIIDFAMKAVNTVKWAWNKIVSFKNKISWSVWNVVWKITGQRALWWNVQAWKTYEVWENWRELFTPNTSWKIIPNKDLGWSWFWSININLWWVVVQKEADENRLIEKIKDELTRTLQLQKMGIS